MPTSPRLDRRRRAAHTTFSVVRATASRTTRPSRRSEDNAHFPKAGPPEAGSTHHLQRCPSDSEPNDEAKPQE